MANTLPFVRDMIAPVASNKDMLRAPEARCVLGVLSREMGQRDDWHFPPRQAGVRLLAELGVPEQYCEPLAAEIICANDDGDFPRAWRLLDIAHRLVYREFRRRQRVAQPRRPWLSWAEWAGERSLAAECASVHAGGAA